MTNFTLLHKSFNLLLIAKLLFCVLPISEGLGLDSITNNLVLTDLEAIAIASSTPEIFVHKNVCYEKIGCFYNGEPFYHPVDRPVSVQPKECKETTFPLYTPSNPTESYNLTLDKSSVQNSPYSCDLPTIVIAHGFNTDSKEFVKMKDKIQKILYRNVIVPDYPECAKPAYFQATANMRTVGARLGYLMKLLMDYCNYKNASTFHIIGHSLGAHMSGYASNFLDTPVHRISGLDVAAPYFQGDYMKAETRLSKDDACFVDIIHTNGAKTLLQGGFGFYDPVGHIDFFANNGFQQPGCNPFPDLTELKVNFTHIFGLLGCSHSRAHELYAESIQSEDCKFTAVKCDSYPKYQSKLCKGGKEAEMGFHATPMKDVTPGTIFYLETNADPPYCKNDKKPDQNPFNSFFDTLLHYFSG